MLYHRKMLNPLNQKLLTILKLKGIGPATLQKILNISGFAEASLDDLAALNSPLSKAISVQDAWSNAQRAVDHDISIAEKTNTRILSILDEDYPILLKETSDKPFFLYVQGQFSQDPLKSVAIIGTREPTDHGAIMAERITSYMSSTNWSVVSGLAIGCDGLAHQSALNNQGHTIAVLAHGLHTIAPKQHIKLAEQILSSGGALISEYGFGVDPHPSHFIKRDRTQAGLSKGVVMIQSDSDGGSLHAARAAISYSRVLAIPLPTEKDLNNSEKKIQANKILCTGLPDEKAKLLDCPEDELKHLFIIRNKEDYQTLALKLLGN